MSCFNAVTLHITLNGQPVSVVHRDKHSTHDRHFLNNVCDMYQLEN